MDIFLAEPLAAAGLRLGLKHFQALLLTFRMFRMWGIVRLGASTAYYKGLYGL